MANSKPVAKYPTAPTDAQFSLAYDNYQTTNSSPIGISDTTISLTDPTKAPTNTILSIGSELLFVTAGGSNPVSVTRAFDGTTAAAYGALSAVKINVVAYSHNSLVSEIEQLEKGVVPSNKHFDFTAIQPGGSLTSGIGNTVTIAVVPKGVNGTDTNHYLYISGGTGAAEAVLITGGTATAGGLNQTLIFTPANNHSGAWTITSASGGLAEAIQDATYRVINLTSNITLYNTVTIPATFQINGNGYTATWDGPSLGNMFHIAGDNVTVQNFKAVLDDAEAFVKNSGTRSSIKIYSNVISGGKNPIYFTAGTQFIVTKNTISGFTAFGISFAQSVDINYVLIVNNFVDGRSSIALNGGCIGAWGSYTAVIGNQVISGGSNVLDDQAIVILNSAGQGLHDVFVCNNSIEVHGALAFEAIGLAGATNFLVSSNLIKMVATETRTGFYGIEINECSDGVVCNNTIHFNKTGTQVAGLVGFGVERVLYEGNRVYNWPVDADSGGIQIVLPAVSFSDVLASISLNNNHLVNGDNTSVGSCILVRVDDAAGTVSNLQIKGNYCYGSPATGAFGLKCVDNAGITWTNTVIAGNTFVNCDIAVRTEGTDPWLSNNHYIACDARYSFGVPGGGGAKLNDNMDTALTVIASATSIAADDDIINVRITGTTTTTTITGGWLGRKLYLFKTDAGSVTVGGGGNIPGSHTLAQYGGLQLMYDGTNWY